MLLFLSRSTITIVVIGENTVHTFPSVYILNKMANNLNNLLCARLLDKDGSIQNVSWVAVLSCSYFK